jgi:hypothetical protein
MTPATCPREVEVARAVPAGTISQELRDHVGRCEVCLGTWLQSAAHSVTTPPPALDPSALWERAGRLRRLRAEAQMSRIVTGAQVAAGVLILAVLVFFGSQSATWSSLTFPAIGNVELAAGLGIFLLLTAVGVSSLIAQDS